MTLARNTRLLGAATVVALTAGALGVVAPAAATSAPLAYTCAVLGQTRTFTMVADLDAPPTIAFGETIAANAIGTLTVPEDVTAAIRSDLAARRVDGKADVNAAVSGTSRPWTLVFPATDVPAAGPMTLIGVGTAGNYAATKVGTTYDVVAGHFTAVLNFYNAAGAPTSPVPSTSVSCSLNAGQTGAVDTIEVVKDTTTTKVKGRDRAPGVKPRVKVKVKTAHGRRAKGEVRVKILRKGDKVRTSIVTLEKGHARVPLAGLSGSYVVRAKYLGTGRFKGSSVKDKISV